MTALVDGPSIGWGTCSIDDCQHSGATDVRQCMIVNMHHLVGLAEIAELLGISRQRADIIAKTHDDFPQPTAVLSAGRIWKREAVEAWARETGRIK